MSFPTSNFSRNLKLPETGLNFALNIFLYNAKITTLFNPNNYCTSANLPLLKIVDPCPVTLGKISFLPLDFLETYLINNNFIDSNNPKLLKYNKLELKQYYINLCLKLKIFNKYFFEKETYKDIPIKYFRKSYLTSDFSKAIDFCKLNTEITINKEVNDILKFDTIHPDDIIIRNENEWLSKQDLYNIIQAKLYCLSKEKFDQIYFIPLLYIKNSIFTISYTYSEIEHSYEWNNIPRDKRFIIIVILYRSHFTSIIIDQCVKLNKYKECKKFAYFFNSCGYDPNMFTYNHNYWFIDGSMKILNHKCLYRKNEQKSHNYMIPIEALALILHDKFNITNFVFNTFSIQNFDSECGIFSSMFLFFFINLFQYKNHVSILELKYIYFNTIILGNDLIYGMLRGLFFFTKEDITLNNITEYDYNDSPFIFSIKNRKFIQYEKIYNKNLNYIMKIINK